MKTRKFRALALAGLLFTTLASCGDSTAVESNGVRVSVASQGLLVMNNTTNSLAIAAFNQEILPLIDWIKCADMTPACLRLPPGETLLIPYGDINGGAKGTIVVYAWTVFASPAGYMIEDVATLKVEH